MNKTLAHAAAAVALGAALLAPFEAAARPYGPPPHFHHHHHHSRAGLVAAGILGVALGAAIAAEPQPVVYRPSVVYAPPAPVYVQQPVYVQPQPQVVYQQPAPVYVQAPQPVVYQQLPPAPVYVVPTPFNSTCAPFAQQPAAAVAQPAETAPATTAAPAATPAEVAPAAAAPVAE